jgi:cysteine desulfurase/selenocysteine lyase
MAMGFVSSPGDIGTDVPLYRRYREEFPVTKNVVYLNHAAVAPLCRRAAEAMKGLAQDALEFGSLHYDKWMATYEGLRVAAARLIHATPREIALVKNTSEGIATVALGISWRSGDRIVAFREEFPANYFPWARLAAKGVTITWLSIYDPLDAIAEATRGARLLAVSHVNYLRGFRVDLERIGAICHKEGCFFFVDAIQGMGVFPIDVERFHIDALSADGHKWMLGPEGHGVLYVRKDRTDEIEPIEFGWTNVAHYADYASRDMTLRADAGRYECGTLNTIGCFGQRAGIEFLLEVGIDAVCKAVDARGAEIYDGVRTKGYEVICDRTVENGSGIVSFRHPSVDSRVIVSRLRDANIAAAPRQGWIRTSPHFYISPDNIARMLDVLPGV